jgi:hypothetical protein
LFEQHLGLIGASFRHRLEVVLASLSSRFGLDDQRGSLIVPELRQEDLAEMIGSSRPMISKMIADMTREGRLTRSEQHHFILRNNVRPSRATDPASVTSGAHRNDKPQGLKRRSDGAKIEEAPIPGNPANSRRAMRRQAGGTI